MIIVMEHFSTLLPMTFDQAVDRFSDGEIDLLHIDGYHTYEAVRHDFETWQSKVSGRGVILFHDVMERIYDFGVWRLWKELTPSIRASPFSMSMGWACWPSARTHRPRFATWSSLAARRSTGSAHCFEQLGKRVRLQMELDPNVPGTTMCPIKNRGAGRIRAGSRLLNRSMSTLRQELSRLRDVEQECQELQQVTKQESSTRRLNVTGSKWPIFRHHCPGVWCIVSMTSAPGSHRPAQRDGKS